MRCPNCGFEVAAGERFCGECGTPVQTAAPTPAEQVYTPSSPPPQQEGPLPNWAYIALAALSGLSGLTGCICLPICFGPLGIVSGLVLLTSQNRTYKYLGVGLAIASAVLMILGFVFGAATSILPQLLEQTQY
ncbi:MAG: zinc-ribbon domain-containing protein [Chloroflexota bacterium]|nr:zinc-ribbon domain-containing protein [Chloroflexota bacterium]